MMNEKPRPLPTPPCICSCASFMDFKEQNPIILWMGWTTITHHDYFWSFIWNMKHCCNALFWIFFLFRIEPQPIPQNYQMSITILCDWSNEGNASDILFSFYLRFTSYLGSINGTHHSETINNVRFIIIQTKQRYNTYLFQFESYC